MELKEYGVKKVTLRYKAFDFSMCRKKSQKGVVCLASDDEVILCIPCPNEECTSCGFSLIDILIEAVQKKQIRT